MAAVARTPLFLALTRPVSVMGLPMTYVVLLFLVVIGGFVATLSVIYIVSSGAIGYIGLRLLAAYDPRFFDVVFVSLSRTPLPARWFAGRGISYGV